MVEIAQNQRQMRDNNKQTNKNYLSLSLVVVGMGLVAYCFFLSWVLLSPSVFLSLRLIPKTRPVGSNSQIELKKH